MCIDLAISGKDGKYISSENGPKADSAPSTIIIQIRFAPGPGVAEAAEPPAFASVCERLFISSILFPLCVPCSDAWHDTKFSSLEYHISRANERHLYFQLHRPLLPQLRLSPRTAVPRSLTLGSSAFSPLTSTKKNSLAKEIWPRCGDLLTNTFNDVLSKKTYRV